MLVSKTVVLNLFHANHQGSSLSTFKWLYLDIILGMAKLTSMLPALKEFGQTSLLPHITKFTVLSVASRANGTSEQQAN